MGVNVTVIVQLPLPRMLLPQLFVWAKGPLVAILPIMTALAVEFLTVIVNGWLVVPMV